ncbi:hypothetical protein [Pseudomonas entomophila]|uniref:hypothetical protein n=1 Tax=Pseudomonas entomophila TaxID=312306 RepID=UPI001F0108E6|nr:hypothetical protein [Pseudomonas entomophila]MCG8293114.1 hypothetical protein [Pseudomonas entomophila]
MTDLETLAQYQQHILHALQNAGIGEPSLSAQLKHLDARKVHAAIATLDPAFSFDHDQGGDNVYALARQLWEHARAKHR